jgi:hypothetical protein
MQEVSLSGDVHNQSIGKLLEVTTCALSTTHDDEINSVEKDIRQVGGSKASHPLLAA